jgi:hypothetical protein
MWLNGRIIGTSTEEKQIMEDFWLLWLGFHVCLIIIIIIIII